MKIEEQVFSYIEKHNMIEAGDQVIVGVSGGADSVCLLFLLKKYQKKKPFALYGIHVNHGIRGEEAIRDQEYARNVCEKLQVPFQVYAYKVPELAQQEKLSLEEAGRIARRRAFLKKAEEIEKQKHTKIALAHHENDNAETVLHNLIRGTGAAGLGGIRPTVETKEEITYIRPLLKIPRKQIEEYLTANGISWMTDSTNEGTEYTRNKIRHILIPEMEKINSEAVSHIGRTAERICMIEEYLMEQADILYREYVCRLEHGYRIKKALFQQKKIMQSYVVMLVLQQAIGQKKDITSLYVEGILALAKGRTGASISLFHGLKASQNYGDIYIGKEKTELKALKELEFQVFPWENQQIPEKTYTKWFDYDKIENSLKIRYRESGDFLTVTETSGKKKLKDYFIDCKIPREERESLTLLADGSHILWVIGYRISQYYKVTSQTKTVLKVHVKGVDEDE